MALYAMLSYYSILLQHHGAQHQQLDEPIIITPSLAITTTIISTLIIRNYELVAAASILQQPIYQ